MIILEKIKIMLNKALEVLLSMTILSMVFVAVLGVFTRLILKNQASFTTEFLRYALLWTSLFSAAYAFGEKGHISITFIKDKLKGKALIAVEVFTELMIIFFAIAILIYGGYKGMMMGMNEISPTLGLRIGHIYSALPISGIFITFYSIINLMNLFKDDKDAPIDDGGIRTN